LKGGAGERIHRLRRTRGKRVVIVRLEQAIGKGKDAGAGVIEGSGGSGREHHLGRRVIVFRAAELPPFARYGRPFDDPRHGPAAASRIHDLKVEMTTAFRQPAGLAAQQPDCLKRHGVVIDRKAQHRKADVRVHQSHRHSRPPNRNIVGTITTE